MADGQVPAWAVTLVKAFITSKGHNPDNAVIVWLNTDGDFLNVDIAYPLWTPYRACKATPETGFPKDHLRDLVEGTDWSE